MSVDQLRSLAFDGVLHVVNPRGGMVFGQEAVFDCKSIGDPVDAAYLCVPREGILKAARDAIDAGIRNLVVITAGFAEVGGEGAQLEAELKALCESNGVNALGPNCLGFRNILDGVGLGSIPFVEQHAPGTIALVTVSGSVVNAVASYGVQQGIGFTHLISTGNEMNISAADLVDYLVDIPEVKAITLFLEAVKDPATLAVAAERARTARKPIVALKAGFAPATAAIAAAHTSAVLGDDRVFDAACDRLGIIRVSTFEEMITTAAAIVGDRPRQGAGGGGDLHVGRRLRGRLRLWRGAGRCHAAVLGSDAKRARRGALGSRAGEQSARPNGRGGAGRNRCGPASHRASRMTRPSASSCSTGKCLRPPSPGCRSPWPISGTLVTLPPRPPSSSPATNGLSTNTAGPT